MARKKTTRSKAKPAAKKTKTARKVTPKKKPAPTPPPEKEVEEDSLPEPAGIATASGNSASNGISTEDISTEGGVSTMGVTDATPEAAVTNIKAGNPQDMVTIRAIQNLDTCPRIGGFNLADVKGVHGSNGTTVRGRFANGYDYRVPRFVGEVINERQWGIIT